MIDTNVLIYARDPDCPTKAAQAVDWISRLTDRNEAVIGPQILNEFVSVSLKRFKTVPKREIHRRAAALIPLCLAPLDADVTAEALVIHAAGTASWWDALVVSSALAAGCRFLLSEDMQAGHRFGSLTIVNPFETKPEAILQAN